MSVNARLLFCSVAVALGLVLLGSPLSAAEVKITKDPLCGISLSGDIEDGDARELKAKIQESSGGGLCLNSQGGSYPEALKIIDVLIAADGVATVVKQNAECYSACALVFLAGSYRPEAAEGEKILRPRRTLFPGGKLGFHAPYSSGLGDAVVSTKTVNAAMKVGINSVVDLLERNKFKLFPERLLRKAMRLGPTEMYEVETVSEAARAGIEIPQQVRLPAVDKDAAVRACKAAFDAVNDEIGSLIDAHREQVTDVGRYFVEFEVGADIAQCEVMYVGRPDKLFVSVTLENELMQDALTKEVARDFRDNRNTELASQWYYLLDGKTKIASLRSGGQIAVASAPSAAKKPSQGAPQIFRNYDFSGADIRTLDATSADDCAARCAKEGTCTAFSYNRWAKKCFLKSSFEGARFEPRSVSGSLAASYKPGRKPDTVQNFRDRKFKDKPSDTNAASSFEDCKSACLKDSGCIAINFQKSKRQCQFFTSVNEYFPDAGYDAAMRWEAP